MSPVVGRLETMGTAANEDSMRCATTLDAQADAAADAGLPEGGEAKTAPADPWTRFGWLMAVVWLVFLVFPIAELVRSEAALPWLVVAWCGVAAFALAYVVGSVLGMRHPWHSTPKIALVTFPLLLVFGALTLPALGWSALGFLPFIMSFASYGMGWKWHWPVTACAFGLALVALIVVENKSGVIWLLVMVFVLGVVNTVNVWLISRSVQSERLRLDLATSHEREAISRDVHDLIGHSLTVVKLKAELASKLIDHDPERAKAELADITHLTGEAISGVRATVTGLRASTLAEQLAASRSAVETAGLALDVDGNAEALSTAQSLTASWVLREATTNILRHAGASRVTVELRAGTMRVADNGRGHSGATGNGLRGMAERASAAGATLAVGPVAGGGTEVVLEW